MTTPLDISDFIYNTGTLTIAPGDTTATFSGTSLSANIKDGDYLFAGGSLAVIETVTDDTHTELFTPWAGSSITAGTYVILKASMLRNNAVQIGYDTAAFLAFLDNTTIWYVVEGAAPDPSVGEDGNRALKTNVTPWQQWLKTGGVWVEQAGSPGGPGADGATWVVQSAEPATSYPANSLWVDSDSVDLDVYQLSGSPLAWSDTGINLKGATGPASLKPIEAWVTATAYVVGPPASFVSQSGSSYECLVAHTSGTFATDLAAGKWGIVAAKGADGTGIGDMVAANNLSDLADIPTARTNLGLGTAATTAASDYATAAQGAKADSAIQSIVEGVNITVDDTDPLNPVVSSPITTPTVQTFLSGSGTYTTPAGVKWIEVKMVGGGAGGLGGGTGGGTGGSGGSTCWNTSGAACTSPLVSAGGSAGSAGGSVSGSLTPHLSVSGAAGQGADASQSGTHHASGGIGGGSFYSGAGAGVYNAAGTNAAANSGSGGGGGGMSATATGTSGSGGGAGAYSEFIITSPGATYTYAVGSGGTGGTAGTNGSAGGNGAAGRITVIEHYGS